jgi:membrane fusion protein, multidrug efflux system
MTTVKTSFVLPLVGSLLCLPLTSCNRIGTKADAATAEVVPVRAARAITEDVPLEIPAVGHVEAINSVEVKSRVAGVVTRVGFQDGQNVAKGQILFTIDPSALERQAAEQRFDLERDQAMEQQARAVVARDVASQKQNQSEANVAVKLGELGVISGQRVNELVTASDTSRAELRSDQAAVDAAAAATRADRARLAQTDLQLNFTQVSAPLEGRTGAALVKAGDMVRDNDTTLVSLMQMAPIEVVFGIPEQSLTEVRRFNATGSLAVEAGDGSGTSLQGSLVFIDNTVDPVSGTIRLKARFPNTENALWPGEFVNVRLRLSVERGKTVVPQSAVQDGLDGKYVWLAQSGLAYATPVTVLRSYKPSSGLEQAVIGSGIKPGDLVVTEGQLRLTDGAHISLLNTPRMDASASHSAASTD